MKKRSHLCLRTDFLVFLLVYSNRAKLIGHDNGLVKISDVVLVVEEKTC